MNRTRKKLRFLALFLVLFLCTQFTLPLFAAGTEEMIQIRNAEDLLQLAENCTLDTWSVGKTVVLQADISLKDVDTFTIPTFAGTFDGNGYSITGFRISGNYSTIGFFGTLQEQAIVKDLKIEGNVCPSGDAAAVGGIVGINYGSIRNCSYTGYVTGEDEVGGIAGVNESSGEIRRCQSNAVVSGNHSTGGITGVNHGTLNNCKNVGDINTQTASVALDLDDFTLENMKNLNSTENAAAHIDTGGIAGLSDGKIYYCTNSGVIGYPHVGYNVGGIAGRLHQGYLQNCTNSGKVLGRKDVGGIVGQMEPFLEIQYLKDKFQELDEEADKFLDMCDNAFQHVDNYSSEALELMKSISENLDKAGDAAGEVSTASADLLHIYNQELNVLNDNLKEFGENLPEESNSVHRSEENRDELPSVSGNDWNELPNVSGGDWNGNWDGSDSSLDEYRDLLENLIRNSTGPMDTMLDETTARENLFRDNLQILDTELESAGNSLKRMSDVLTDGVDQTNADMDALSEQARILRDIVSEIRDDLFGLEGISVKDVSDEESDYDTSAFQKGKITECSNLADVEADINVGGIVGQIATEYDADPEEDISVIGSESLETEYTVKAVVRDSRNEGKVLAKKDCVGGILGKTEIGAVISCESYGDVSSTGGNYVGGIAGLSGATIRECFAKCTISGNKYVGGILGSGQKDSDSDVGNTVLGCYSFISIQDSEQYAGAVAGVDEGTFIKNYFVSDELQGIERTNYSGKAEPIAYSDLLSVEGLPEEFRQLTLSFVVDEETVKTVSFTYGDSFDDSIFPEIPEKEGYYGRWDTEDLTNLCFDTVVTAVYLQSVSALTGDASRSDNRQIFFAEGQFEEGDVFVCTEQETKPEELIPEGFREILGECLSFSAGGTGPEAKINREVVEVWKLQIPDDGTAAHEVRYLPPDGKRHLAVCVRQQDGSWSKVEQEEVGSYIRFRVEGESVELAVVSTLSVWWVWLVVLGILLLILSLICRLVYKLLRYCLEKKKKAKNAVAPGANNDETKGERKETDEAELPGKAEEQKREQPKHRKKRVILIVVISVSIIGLAAAAFLYLRYEFGSGMAAYNLLKDYAEQPQLGMEFDVTANVGPEEISTKTQVVRTELEGKTLYCIEQQGMKFYYADGVVFLENGKAFRAGSLIPDYSQLLPHIADLYHSVDVTVSGDLEEKRYSIITKQGTVKDLLETFVPAIAEQFSEIQIANVDLYASEKKLTSITFSSNGTLNDAQGTTVSVTAEIKVDDAVEVSIPEEVQETVINGTYEAQEVLTEELFRLLTAWNDFNHREKMAGRLQLKADCGILSLNDTLQIFRVTENDTQISCIRINAQSVYFTENAICDRNGNKVSSKEKSITESAKLLEFIYQLCLNSNFGCTETGGSYIYTVMLDAEGAKTVAHAVVPETAEMDISYGTCSLQITVTEGEIAGIRFVCDGDIDVLHMETPVSVTGELLFEDEAVLEDFSIPAAVLKALTADTEAN